MTRRNALQMLCAAANASQVDLQAQRSPAALDIVRFGIIGVGLRGQSLMSNLLTIPQVTVTALADLERSKVMTGIDVVASARKTKPAAFHNGPADYRNLLGRGDVDAVLIATGNEDHARMAVDAMRAGKHVLSEVPAATTVAECWDLVRACEESNVRYMLAENYTYFRTSKVILNMVSQGLFGETTYAECGYTHDTRSLQFEANGAANWRSQRAQLPGDRYPLHAIGTVSQWLGVNRGDRFVALESMASPAKALNYDLAKRFGPDSPQAKTKFAADTVVTLLKTAQGKLVELRNSLYAPKPEPGLSYHNLVGTKATYKDEDFDPKIWIEGRSAAYHWEPLARYQQEFDHPLWKRFGAEAAKTGHRGGDFVQLMDFVTCLREGRPSPIDVYDGATWSAIIELSAKSVTGNSALQEFPDFTRGKWQSRKA